MDVGSVVYRLVAVSVACLLVAFGVAAAWFFVPTVHAAPTVAVLWVALAGFAFLAVVTFGLLAYARSR